MKRALSITALLLLLVPQISSAAWWNPASWFKSDAPQRVEPPVIQVTLPIVNATNTPEQKTQVIEKVIKVDNPDLQKQINALLAENADLRDKLSTQTSLTSQLNQCKMDLNDLKDLNNSQSVPNPEILKEQRVLQLKDMLSLDNPCFGIEGCTPNTPVQLPQVSLVIDQIKSIQFLDNNFKPPAFTNPSDFAKVFDSLNLYVSTYIKYSGY